MEHSKTVADLFNRWAERYQTRFMNVDLYAESFDLFCKELKSGASLLEVGCGPGNITNYLLGKRPDLEIHGIDLAEEMIALAQKNNPQASFEVMDCRDIRELEQEFDGIMCGFCLPYLSKEESLEFISASAALLNPGGLLCISTMEDDYSNSGYQTSSDGKDRIYMYFHEEAYLAGAMKNKGFRIIDVQRKCYESNGKEVTDLILIGALNQK
ncbi:MAG: SAM-dependent methyltransferase [Crocinitomicaceae bacterium]|jgi:cyclopropane fatty-acyl-phospholipid synthase-like methyltransferase|nr:SAM-dependent methyltransferase [Crocinitomicaceae bacterium]